MSDLFQALKAAIPAPDRVLFELGAAGAISYGEAFALSARLANVLRGAGVTAGDRVAVQVDKSWQAVALYLATLRAGAAFLPLNTGYTPAEIDYFLGDAKPRVLVCAPGQEEVLRPAAERAGVGRLLTLGGDGTGSLIDAAAGESEAFHDVPRGPGDLGAILYTSGTTGRAKGAMLTQENLLSNALTLRQAWRFTGEDVLIHALPIFHTHGLFVAINTLMLAGGTMIWMAKFDADAVLAAMPRATSMMGVPTFYTRLLDHPGLNRETAAHMRLFVSGSAPLLAETHRDFEARTGHRILERYGMTEAGMITSNPYDGERRPGSVGPPLANISVRVADPETARVLPAGEIGVLEIKGPNVFKGYWGMPEKTAEEFRSDGYFITGDIATIDEAGYVTIVGRAKDLIITGGYNVYPKEVESEIDALPGVVESAVIGVAHPDLGEGVTAVVVAAPGAALSKETVAAALEGRLARFKQPKSVVIVDSLPRNSMGKVQKNVLRERFADIYAPNPASAH